LVEKYLGSLPVLESQETWQDHSRDYPIGIHERKVYKGLEPKSQTTLVFTGPIEWNLVERFKISALTDVLRIKLRERLREDKGGTYGVGIRNRIARIPKERYQISISFGSDPARVEELKKEVFLQLDSLVNFGTTNEYLDKVKETKLRGYEVNLRENSYWLRQLEFAYFYDLNPAQILDLPDRVKSLSLEDIQQIAKKYLNTKNYVDVVLYPKNWGEENKE